MPIDPELIIVTPVNEITTVPLSELQTGQMFGYTGDGNLKKVSTNELLGFIKSGNTGFAKEANTPTPYDPGTYPDGLVESYKVVEPISTSSDWYALASAPEQAKFPITQPMLDANSITFDVTDGVVSVFVSPKIADINNITNNITNITNENTYNLDPEQIVPSEALYNDTPETLAGDVLKRVDKATGVDVNYREVITWTDGTVMTDAKADGVIYIKRGVKYYRMQFENQINVRWFGAKGDGVNNDAIAINKALDIASKIGGITVLMEKPKVRYLLGNSLLIGSNTTLLIDEAAELFLANSVSNVMIGNKNKSTVGNTTIVDENITVIGGIWNGNKIGQSKWSGTPGTSVITTLNLFSGVRNLKILNGIYINSRTYGMLFSNIDGLIIDNCNVDVFSGVQDNGDGIHLLGLCRNFRITNCTLKSDDNFIALNADDVAHGPNGLFGKIENGFINNITVNNNEDGQGMRLLSGVSPIHKVTISNIKGSAAYLAVCSTLDIGVGDFEDITFENIELEFKVSLWNYFSMVGNFGNVTLKNIHIKSDSAVLASSVRNRYFYIFSEGANTPNTKVRRLVMDNIEVSNLNTSVASIAVILVNNNVNIESLIADKITSKGNLKPTTIVLLSNSSISNLYTSNLDVDYTNNKMLALVGTASITNHYIDGSVIKTFTPILKGTTTAGTGTYTVQNGFYSIGNGIVNFEINIAWSAHDGTGQMVIDLPKGVRTLSIEYSPCDLFKTNIPLAAGESAKCLIYRPASRLQLYKETNTALSALMMVASGGLTISGFYYVSTTQ